ncbi:hypothetical protein [Haloactinopolyspora alba]|uniref:hypothetical protein n=1 Tax=Haloactinopolyspora alba TaxID=648780 RepID=UPI0013ED35B0|nr:hypothetical protein [Haloactinopolyspora alba]
MLANVALYWFTGTIGSSVRLYYEMDKSPNTPTGPTTVPIALAGAVDGASWSHVASWPPVTISRPIRAPDVT